MHATTAPLQPHFAAAPERGDRPDALALLAMSHDELRQAFDRLAVPASGASPVCALGVALGPTRAELVSACLRLQLHAMAVTELVYPAAHLALAHDDATDAAEAGLARVRQAVDDLLAPQPDPSLAADRLGLLRRALDRQFADEEVALFARLSVDGVDLDDLGTRFAIRRQELLAEFGLAPSGRA